MAGEKGEKQDILYVGVQNPIEVRRTILEATKDVVEMLQKYERFRAVKQEKINTVNVLQEQIKEITKLINKLKADLPKVDIRIRLNKEEEMVEKERKAVKEEAKPKKKVVKKEAAPKKMKELSELEKLEAELSAIEGKLGKV